MTTAATIPSTDIVFRRNRDGGRALVFLHGFLDDQHVRAPVLAGLSAPGFETVQFDQAGFGDRTAATGPVTLDRFAADLSAVVDAIGKPFVLVGHSMAGPVIELAAAAHPERALGLVLVAPIPTAGGPAARRGHRVVQIRERLPGDPPSGLAVDAGSRVLQDRRGSRECLAATHTRFARLLARPSVQERFQQAAKLSPQAAFDLELNMGERIGPRTSSLP